MWTSINFPVVNDYDIRKDIEKEILMGCLKKFVRAGFSKHALPISKTWLSNLDFYQFFCGDRLIHSKIHVKSCLCIDFEENH